MIFWVLKEILTKLKPTSYCFFTPSTTLLHQIDSAIRGTDSSFKCNLKGTSSPGGRRKSDKIFIPSPLSSKIKNFSAISTVNKAFFRGTLRFSGHLMEAKFPQKTLQFLLLIKHCAFNTCINLSANSIEM